jgi:glutathione S-transferase
MLTLYYWPQTRAERPRWMLEELQVPYQLKPIDISKGEHKQAEYLKIHPHGVLPALKEDDTIIIESAAICTYLADKFPEKNMAPTLNARAVYYQWLFYAVATLEPPIMQTHLHTHLLPEVKRNPQRIAQARQVFNICAGVLSSALVDKQFLIDEQFSTADLLIGANLIFARYLNMLEDFPILQAYVKRLTERPAYRRMRKS